MSNVPSDWQEFSESQDRKTFVLPGHSVTEPRAVVFSRKLPAYNKNTGFSLPSYNIKASLGYLNALGQPMSQKGHVNVEISLPVGAEVTAIKSVMTQFGALLSDAEIQDDAVGDFMFPDPAAAV